MVTEVSVLEEQKDVAPDRHKGKGVLADDKGRKK